MQLDQTEFKHWS